MYARVARFEGAEPDAIRQAAREIASRAESGPPEGVPASGFTLLVDAENGRGLAITLFETEEDLRKGDEALNAMSRPGERMGQRTSVETYEAAVDVRS